MSRALDAATKKALEKGDHRDAFREVAGAIEPQENQLLEIEFLPSNHGFPFQQGQHALREGNAIAIPKASLVQAFIFARKLLFQYRAKATSATQDEVLDATAVMLLMDPEHLTAANTRKRVMEKLIHDSEMVRKELYLIDSFLTSRLHRHTKSPTLWSHRRWLLHSIRSCDQRQMRYHFENVIFISAERHPRNYYAWCHGRDIIKQFGATVAPAAFQPVKAVREWCFAHHDDVSGWMMLLSVLSLPEMHLGTHEALKTEDEETFDQTLNLTQSFRWRNESVWYFLRLLAGRLRRHQELWQVGQGLWSDRQDRKVLDDTRNWTQDFDCS